MTRTPSDFDVVVIGAGAAGIAAGKQLAAARLSFVIIEARNRIGGRALTRETNGIPLDLGCGWLHSADRNPWTQIAAGLGFTIDKTPPFWTGQSIDPGWSDEDRGAFNEAAEAFYGRLHAADTAEEDFPARRLLEPGCRWNPLLDAVSSYVNGAELGCVSVEDWKRYQDSEINWRVAEGYGAAISAFGARLPVRLDCAVTLIDHEGAAIAVQAQSGRVTAEAVIVTVPPPLLADETVAFKPPLPVKVGAACALPLGLADKLAIAIEAPDLPANGHFFGDPAAAATGSYHLRPFGRPLIEGFFGGSLARELEEAGAGAFFEFARGELRRVFGSAFVSRLTLFSETAWARDPWSRGAYSHALPGRSDARQTFSAPVDERLFFAGEACSKHSFSTAHGAYLTGVEAARQVIAANRRKRR